MKWLLPLGIVLLVIGQASVGAVAGVEQTQTVTITVSVVQADGDPISGVELTAEWDGGSTTETTASNGRAFVDVPENVDVTFRFDHGRYMRNDAYTLLDATEQDISITMYPKALASVTVVDGEGNPVEGATVEFQKRASIAVSGTTGSDGVFETDFIESGEYTVGVSKSTYRQTETTMEVAGKVARELTIERGFITLEVSVKDDHFDPPKPIEGATITVTDVGSVKTQSNGVQQMNVPVNAKFEMTVEKEGYTTIERSITIHQHDRQIVFTAQRTPKLSVDVLNERVVVGEQLLVRVTDEYGDPEPNATVYVDGNAVGSPNQDGTVIVRVDSAGEYSVYAENGTVSSDRVTVTGVRPQTETPEPTNTATATPSGAIEEPGALGFGFDVGSFGAGFVIGILLALGLAVVVARRLVARSSGGL